MQLGYAFHWPPRKSPYFLKPNGENIICEVHDYVPYVPHREPTWAERLVAAAAPLGAAPTPTKRARLTEDPVIVDGGNASTSLDPTPALCASVTGEGDGPLDPAESKEKQDDTDAEATTLRHLLTHLPKSPHCVACMKAKMIKKHARRRHAPSGPHSPTKFGEFVVADHLFSLSLIHI